MEKRVVFVNSLGHKLCGILSLPAEIKTPPLVVSCHGFQSEKNSDTNTLLMDNLRDSGIAVFRFDFSGHKDSEGLLEEITVSQGADDLGSALKSLRKSNPYGFSDIGIFASSYGGNAALWYASSHPEIRAMALKAPVSDYAEVRYFKLGQEGIDEWKEKGALHFKIGGEEFKINYAFYADVKAHNTFHLAKTIQAQCLIIHGDEDSIVPYEQSVELARSLGAKASLKTMHKANHTFRREGQLQSVVKDCAVFLKMSLLEK